MYVKLNGNRKVTGILRGFDPFLNLVLEETVEETANREKNSIGMVVCCICVRALGRVGACVCPKGVTYVWNFAVHFVSTVFPSPSLRLLCVSVMAQAAPCIECIVSSTSLPFTASKTIPRRFLRFALG